MKEFKGTKGNWEFSDSMGVIFSEDCDYIADVCGTNATSEEESANARLIAAAPELLEALMAMTDPLTTYYPQSSDEYQQAVYAIKKALGEG